MDNKTQQDLINELNDLREKNAELETSLQEWKSEVARLKQSQKKYKSLSENAPEGILVANIETKKFIYANSTICQILGYSKDELLEMSVRDIHPQKELEQIINDFRAQAEGKKLIAYSVPCVKKDGSVIYMDISTKKTTIDGKDYNIGFFTDMTERQKTEEALKKSERRYRTLFDGIPVGLYRTSPEGKILDVNLALVEMLGYPDKESVLNINASEVYVTIEDRNIWKENLDKHKIVSEYEAQFRRKNGEIIWVHDSARAVLDENDEILYYDGSLMDITSRKRAELELEKARKEWENIFEAIGHPTLILDSKHNILAANRAVLKLTGKAETELKGEKCYQIFHHKDALNPPEACPMEMIDRKELGTIEMVMEALSGTYLVSCTPVVDETGELDKIIHIATDITDRKAAEKALKESEEKYRLLVENQTDLIVKVDTDGNFLFVSPSYCELFGKSENELIHKGFMPLVHKEDRETTQKAMENLYRPPYKAYMEQRALTKYGWRWIAWMDTAVLDENNIVQEIIGVGRDVTEQKKAEKALRESEERLRTLINASPDIICFKDGQGRWLLANEADLKLFELENVDYKHKTDAELAEYSDFYRDAFLTCQLTDEKAWEKGKISRGEEVIPIPDGMPRVYDVIKMPLFYPDGRRKGLIVLGRDITERKHAEEIQLGHLRFLENMEKIDQAIRKTEEVKPMLESVLQTMLSIFNCDRAWLFYPADPNASYWHVPMMCTTPEFRIDEVMNTQIPMIPETQNVIKSLLSSDEPLIYDPTTDRKMPHDAKRFDVKSQMITAIHPKLDKPWIFGIHFCRIPYIIKDEERRLFKEIGRRLSDALSSLSFLQDLRKSEKKYRLLFESLLNGFAFFQAIYDNDGKVYDGKFLDMNPAYERFTGLHKEEAMGKTILDLMPQTKDAWFDKFDSVVRTGEPIHFEMYHEFSQKYYAVSAYRPREDTFAAVFEDITKRKDAEAVQRRLISIMESTSDMVSTSRPDGQITYVNSAGMEILGWDNIQNKKIKDIHPDWAKEIIFDEGLPQAVQHGIWTGETAVLNSNNKEIPTSQIIMSHKSPTGDIEYFSTIIRDISEQKESAQKINHLNAVLTAIRNINQIIVRIKNIDVLLQEACDNLVESRGFLAAWIVLIDDSDDVSKVAYSALESDSPVSIAPFKSENLPLCIQKILENADNTLRLDAVNSECAHCTISLTYEENEKVAVKLKYGDKIYGIMTVYLPKQIKLDEKEKDLLKEIAEDIAFALHKLELEYEKNKMHAQLLRSQKMEAIGKLAGGIAHDFNNLLQAISLYTETLIFDIHEDDPLMLTVEEIRNATDRAASLTHQLLAFSRRQILKLQPLDINEVIRNISKMLQRLIGEDIELITRFSSDVKYVKADIGQLEQVIMNLAVNARDAMPQGGKLKITVKEVTFDEFSCRINPNASPGEYICVIVADTGVGMDKDTKAQIFDPFFTTKGMGRGTGLGLSTVYGIIKQHNGWIDVYSEPEQGSVFNIYLPVSEKEKKRISEKRSPEKFQGNGERILFVEDEKIIRNVAVDMLTRKGYVVFAAHNTENATKIFKKEHGNFDLMISDVVLPDENGLILASRLLSENPDLPIIMISGYTEQKSHWMSIKEMGLEFLQKPFTLIQLLEIINKVLTEIETE